MKHWNEFPFAGDTSIEKRLIELRDEFGIALCIETGTQAGITTQALAGIFHRVLSIEISPQYHKEAKARLSGVVNVALVLGSSEVVLDSCLSEYTPLLRILFFLDAHGFGHDCPLKRELKVIAERRRSNDVIVIHDFQVEGRPELGYDSYEGQAINIDYVTPEMCAIFPEGWFVSYNDNATGAKRGCAYFTSAAL